MNARADGELLQRALDGERVSDPGILELVAVLHAVQAVDQAGLAPRAEFVSDLRARLLADGGAGARPVAPVPVPGDDGDAVVSPTTAWTPTSSTDTPTPGAEDDIAGDGDGDGDGDGAGDGVDGDDDVGDDGKGGTGVGATVSVLRVAARPLRLLAAAAAGILVLGGGLGVASRSAVPGDALYGIKQLLDRAAVQLADSRLDEGLTYLAQAQEHIEDARNLLDRGAPSTHDLDTALDAASDATTRAQTILGDVYQSERRTEALTELADFYTRAIPQVDAMRPRVPAGSLPAWQRLRDLLGAGRVATLRVLATCVECGERAVQARQVVNGLTGTSRLVPPVTRRPTGAAAPSGSVPGLPLPSATTPDAQLPGGSLPGVTATGGVKLPGGTVNLPSVGITSTAVEGGGGGVTVPGATVDLPTVGITSTGVTVGGGGATLPGVTVSVPTVTLAPTLPRLSVPLTAEPSTVLPTKLPTLLP